MVKSGLIFISLILGVVCRISGQRQCPRLQRPWNAQFVGTCNRNIGSECIFECRDPYILVGSRVRVCRSDGTWSGSTTACELDGCANCGGTNSNCPNLYNPENGYTEGQCTPGIAGQNCQFHCNRGYSLDGNSLLTCLNGGQWSSRAPACRRMSAAMCEEIVIQNGYSTCNQEGGLTVCRIVCNEEYMIVGSSVITCSPSGDWSDQIPWCRRSGVDVTNVCPTLVAPEGGRLVGSCSAASTGDTCQLVCLSGYRPTDTRILICQTSGSWSDTLPRCVGDSVNCPSISVTHGSTTGSCGAASVGHVCTITCNAGYTLSGGSGTLICQANGEWSGSIPTCTARTCPAIAPPVSGGISGTCSPGHSGQTCNFYCNSGYHLVGQSTLTCGSDGRWSGSPPYCTGATCPNLNTPANGARSGTCTQATVGQTCAFSCQAGYILNGQATLFCQPGGSWSSSPPTCIRSTPTSCPSLAAPNHGYMIGTCAPGRVGETCVFGCDEGYAVSGQRTLTCQSNGQWSNSAPHCERSGSGGDGNCPVLTPPPNGEFLECDNRPGGQCTVVCARGYIRSGSRVRTCLSQGTWSGYAPTCTRTDCCG